MTDHSSSKTQVYILICLFIYQVLNKIDLLVNNIEDFDRTDANTSSTEPVGVVYGNVKLPYNPEEYEQILTSPLYFNISKEELSQVIELPTPQLHPTINTSCECSGHFGNIDPTYHIATVYSVNKSCTIKCPDTYPCDGCGKRLEFDGLSHGLVRVAKSIYFDLTLANFIHSSILLGSTSIVGVHRIIQATHTAHGSVFCGKDIHLAATWIILERSSMDVFGMFSCCHCGSLDTAPIIIGDGTKLACQCNNKKLALPSCCLSMATS